MRRVPEEAAAEATSERAAKAAFGKENRARLLRRYFGQSDAVTPATAWLHVYRLLLWIDRTTGLAHCYESDKAQPGRPWYRRSLYFLKWVSDGLRVRPADLATEIDWLFRKGIERLTHAVAALEAERAAKATT